MPRLRSTVRIPWLQVFAPLTAVAVGSFILRGAPGLELDFFAQGAAQIASLLLGAPLTRIDTGWLLSTTDRPVLVSTACSATDFFIIVAALLAWQSARRGSPLWRAAPTALVAAIPLAIAVNALRIVAVTQAHLWVIPHFPENLGASLHLLTGVAIFLPALIALNLLLELHGRIRSNSNSDSRPAAAR